MPGYKDVRRLNEFEIAGRLRAAGFNVLSLICNAHDHDAVIQLGGSRQVWITPRVSMCVLFVDGTDDKSKVYKSPDEIQVRMIDQHLRLSDDEMRKWPIVIWSDAA